MECDNGALPCVTGTIVDDFTNLPKRGEAGHTKEDWADVDETRAATPAEQLAFADNRCTGETFPRSDKRSEGATAAVSCLTCKTTPEEEQVGSGFKEPDENAHEGSFLGLQEAMLEITFAGTTRAATAA